MSNWPELTNEEKSIMQGLVDGLIMKQVVAKLYGDLTKVNMNKITNHLAKIRTKLGAKTNFQAVWMFKELEENDCR